MFGNGKLKDRITELEIIVQYQDRKIRQLKATDTRMKKEISLLKSHR